MRKLSPYTIGKSPVIDPCINCVISMMCSEKCDPKLLYDRDNKKPKPIKMKIRKKRK